MNFLFFNFLFFGRCVRGFWCQILVYTLLTLRATGLNFGPPPLASQKKVLKNVCKFVEQSSYPQIQLELMEMNFCCFSIKLDFASIFTENLLNLSALCKILAKNDCN